MTFRNFARGTLLAALLSTSFLGAAQAQTEVRPFVLSYSAGFFTAQHPSTAFEMVGLLPGFQLTEGDSRVRGYAGAIGNVLIDGRPPNSKDETLETILKRITPDSVERIEVMRSGASGVDFLGFPLLANVILKADVRPKGQVSVEDSIMRHGITNPKVTGRMTWGVTDVLELTGTLSGGVPDSGAGFGNRFNYGPTGIPTRLDTYNIQRHDDNWNVTGGYRQPLFGGLVHVTGLFTEFRMFAPVIDDQYYPVVSHSPGTETEMRTDSEFGVQYNHPLFAGDAEVDFIRRGRGDFHPQTSIFAGVQQVATTLAYSSENILHMITHQKLAPGFSLDLGVDGTLNQLDNTVKLAKGGVNIPLPAATVRLEEKRGEGTLNTTWQAASDLTIEAGVRYELSRLKQTGDSNLTRVFGYLKPRVKASYKFDAENTFRLLITRDAGQLNFNNFVTTIETKVNQVNGGNKNLKPQTDWEGDLTWEHALKGGSVVLNVKHELISDTVDNIPLLGVGGLFNATGNIGGGRLTQIQGNWVTPVAWIPGMTATGTLTYTFSSVLDPLIGVKRSISGSLPWTGKASITQNVPEWGMRFGFNFNMPQGQNAYRYNENQLMHSKDPETEIFAEYKPAPQWLLRVNLRNLLDTRNLRQRFTYAGTRGSSAYTGYEDRRLTYGPELGFYAQYAFGQ